MQFKKIKKSEEFVAARRILIPLALPHFGKSGLAKRLKPIIEDYLHSNNIDEAKRPRLFKSLLGSLTAKNSRFAHPAEKKTRIHNFYDSEQWMAMRYETLRRHGARCLCCGRGPKEGAILQVDHIKPRYDYPELELDLENLQVLCRECNKGKSNLDETDWR